MARQLCLITELFEMAWEKNPNACAIARSAKISRSTVIRLQKAQRGLIDPEVFGAGIYFKLARYVMAAK